MTKDKHPEHKENSLGIKKSRLDSPTPAQNMDKPRMNSETSYNINPKTMQALQA